MALTAAVVAWLLASPAQALELAVPLTERVTLADHVVVAVPVALSVQPNAEFTLQSAYTLVVQASWKGTAPEELSLTLPGGQLGDLTVQVEDQPALQLGRPYALILADTPDGLVLVGGEGAVFPVADPTKNQPGFQREALHRAFFERAL